MINKDYLYSQVFSTIDAVNLKDNSVFIYSHSPEERSHCADYLKERYNKTNFVNVVLDEENDSFHCADSEVSCSLRSNLQIKQFIEQFDSFIFYVDISGINVKLFAVIIKSLFEYLKEKKIEIYIIYSEPKSYKISAFKKKGVYFDLAENIKGISPLPGFEKIFSGKNEETIFIPILGFEGGRFAHVYEEISPEDKNIIPIVGLAGYKAEYPFISLLGNQRPLIESGAWRRIKYASANSIIDAFIALREIQRDNQDKYMRIVPIGTKPHTIAAIIFNLCFPKNTEIVFDHPIRKEKRTCGINKIIVTSLPELLENESYVS